MPSRFSWRKVGETQTRDRISTRDVPLRVLSVRDRVADDVLEEDLENTAGFLVDQARDTLDTTTTGETADSLSDATKCELV